ncbi:MAG: TonB-dependent receptor [Nibricoccus sp.]
MSAVLNAQTGQTGTVSGYIFNAGTKNYISNVEVKDQETGKTAVTDADGRFDLTLPAGPHKLTVTYAGLDTRTVDVEVVAGQRATPEIGLTNSDYGAETIVMDQFVVAGTKEGRAASIAQQKQADVPVNVISSDEFGNIAGGNVGDFLRNVPGISIEYSGPDPRWVSVRGMNPNMTAVTVNGMRGASASSANQNRRFEFDQTSLQDVESIEIFKTPNASLEADTGGGSVNIVSKSAFKQKGRRINYSVLANAISSDVTFGKTVFPEDGSSEYTSKIRPGGTFSYSNSFFNNRLGVTFTANYNEYFVNSHSANTNYAATNSIAAFNANGPVLLDSPTGLHARGFTYGINPITTQRTAVSLNLDFRLTDSTTLWARSQVNTSQLRGGGRSLDVGVNAPTVTPPATNGVAAGWTAYSLTALGDGTATAAAAATSNSSTFAHVAGEFLDKVGADTKFGIGSNTKVGPWKIDTALGLSLSTNHYRNMGSMPVPQVDLYLRGISYRFDQPPGTNYPTFTQLSGPDIYDLSNYVSRVSTSATSRVSGTNVGVNDANGVRIFYPSTSTGSGQTAITYPDVSTEGSQYAPFQLRNSRRAGATDKFFTAKFDVRRDFATHFPIYVQGGGNFRRQDRSTNREGQTRWLYAGPDGVLGSADDYTTLNLDQFKSTKIDDTYGPYRQLPYYDLAAINTYFQNNRNLFKEDVSYRIETEAAFAKSITEKVTGAYAMSGVRFNKLNVLLGLRFERSQDAGEGPAVDNETARDVAVADLLAYVNSQGYATVNAAPAAVRSAFRADAAKLSRIRYAKRTTSSQEYSDFYPNVQLRYSITKDFIVRTSYNKSISRQDFADIMPGYTVASAGSNGPDLNNVTISNTKLKPVYYNNYDLSMEYYFEKGGLLSASIYYKDLKNYTITTTETILPGVDYGYNLSGYIGDNLTRKINSGTAKYKGIELSYSQRLGSLINALRDFDAFAGFTYQQASANTTFGGSATQATNLPMTGVVPRMFNVGVNYRHKALNARVIYNWKSAYANAVTVNNLVPTNPMIRYWDDRGTFDISTSYDIYKKHAVFLDVRNIGNVPSREYIVNKSYTRSYAINGATLYLGIKGTF